MPASWYIALNYFIGGSQSKYAENCLIFTLDGIESLDNYKQIVFCDKKYEYGQGKDSITLFFKVLDKNGEAVKDVTVANLEKYLVFYEGGFLKQDQLHYQLSSAPLKFEQNIAYSLLQFPSA